MDHYALPLSLPVAAPVSAASPVPPVLRLAGDEGRSRHLASDRAASTHDARGPEPASGPEPGANQRRPWRIVGIPVIQRGMEVFRLLTHADLWLSTHKVFNLPNVRCIRARRRGITLKFAGGYLARFLSCRHRGEILVNHYRFLSSHLADGFLAAVMGGGVRLWDAPMDADGLSVDLTFPYHDMEGDLCLTFQMGATTLYRMSFTVVPGHALALPHDQVLFVTMVQGARGAYPPIRKVTRFLGDIAPPVVLFTCVQAIATALHIDGIAGVTVQEHTVLGTMAGHHRFRANYDDLWKQMGGSVIADRVFALPTVPLHKPIDAIEKSHRCRSKYKRQVRDAIFAHVLDNFEQHRRWSTAGSGGRQARTAGELMLPALPGDPGQPVVLSSISSKSAA